MNALYEYIDLMERWKPRTYLVGYRGYRKDPWSFEKTHSTILSLSSELVRRGVKKGDRVVIIGKPCPEWVVSFFAVLHRGAVVIPLDIQSPADFIKNILKKTSPRLIIAENPDAISENPIEKNTEKKSVQKSELEGHDNSVGAVKKSNSLIYFSDIDRISKNSSKEDYIPTAEEVSKDDLAEIVFTSGTYSKPKGVMLTHRNILSNLNPIREGVEKRIKLVKFLTPFRILSTVPYSHMFGQATGIFLPIILGSTIYFTRETSPASLIRSIKKDRILALITVPRVMKLLADHVKAELKARGELKRFERRWDRWVNLTYPLRVFFFLDLHRIMGLHFWAFIVGGAPLDPETHEFWRRTVFSVFQGYGLTETAPMVTLFNPFRHNRSSVGKLFPGQEIKVDEDGEILIRGENVMAGYFDDPELTSSVLKDGWLRTGDIGEMDEEGHVFIRGRKKEMILTSDGHNVYPEDVENVLNAQEGVRESVVFGKSGPDGETVHAVLLLELGADPERIVREVNLKLQRHQRIKGYTVWGGADFPRTSTMKIKKPEVINRVLQQVSERLPSEGIFAELVPGGVDPDARLGIDLGLDSLDLVEVVSRIEQKYGVSLDETLISPETTIKEIESLAFNPPKPYSLPMPRWARSMPVRILRFLIHNVFIIPIFRLICNLKVYGLENLKDVGGPRIICANHTSDLDPVAILLALPLKWRKLIVPAMGLNRFYAYFAHLGKLAENERIQKEKRDLGQSRRSFQLRRLIHGFLYHFITFLFQVYPFPQGAAYRPSLEYSGELLDSGCWILIFPEGRNSESGEVGHFKPGISIMAERTEVPVFPVAIKGMHKVLPPGKRFPKRGKVAISFGKHVFFSKEDYETFAARLEEDVRRLHLSLPDL
ncbi:MAG: AMP-binding protein [Spirochaetota bacterium]